MCKVYISASWRHNRRRRPQARGQRSTIEIRAKCASFRINCATLNVTHSHGNRRICAALEWNFRRWAIVSRLFECSLNFPSASYLNRECIHSASKKSQCYINTTVTGNTSIARTTRGCNEPAVRIKGNKP